jgi:hypothetical protein
MVMITARTERDPANFDLPRTTIFGVCATMPTLRPYGSDQVGNAYSDGPSEIMGKCGKTEFAPHVFQSPRQELFKSLEEAWMRVA